MDSWVIKFNDVPNSCNSCGIHLQAGDGLVLQICSHCLCMDCLKRAVNAFGESVVSCPKFDCEGYLLPGEAKISKVATEKKQKRKELYSSVQRPNSSRPSSENSDNTPKSNGFQNANVVFNLQRTSCEFCSMKLNPGVGIVLQACAHIFCKDCLRGSIAASSGGLVTCLVDYCSENLLEREIKALLPRESYEEYTRKGLLAAAENLPMFQCKTVGCHGLCLLEAGVAKIFLCDICNRPNCIQCEAIHDTIPCETWKKLRRETNASVSDEELIRRAENFGYQQINKVVQDMLEWQPKGDVAGYYEAASQLLETLPLVPTRDDFECMICTRMASEVPQGGVILQQCAHAFCRECLRNIIKIAEELPIPCPYVDSECGRRCEECLSAAEFKALAPADVYEKHVRWGWRIAEDVIQKKFHCLDRNCEGFWEVSEDQPIGVYTCPLCASENCVNCNVIHTGQTCNDYQEKLRAEADRLKDEANRKVQAKNEKYSETEVNKLINNRQFMRCPHCQFVCEKISGCANVTCLNRACRRHFRWYQ